MTIAKARKLIGKKSDNLSDSQIQQTIETARLLSDIFLDEIINKKTFLDKYEKGRLLPKSH